VTVTTLEPDLLEAIRDLRYEDNAGWRRFLAEHPELAEVAKSKPKVSRDARSIGNSKGYEPYRCWSRDADRGRWYRTRGASPDESTDDAAAMLSAGTDPLDGSTDSDPYRDINDQLPQGVFGGSLLELHMATNGGYIVEGKIGSDPRQLEVCRLCGAELKLSRDCEGRVTRDIGGQPEYCGRDCRRKVRNARERAKRAASSMRQYGCYGTNGQCGDVLDTSAIRVAGMREIGVRPEAWNRLQPRNDPSKFPPVALPGGAEDYRFPVHRFITASRRRPCLAAARPIQIRHYRPDRIARRYGTGGRPTAPTLPDGWDRISTWWRFVPKPAEAGWCVTRINPSGWRISKQRSVSAGRSTHTVS
jgi:hypothetical protein